MRQSGFDRVTKKMISLSVSAAMIIGFSMPAAAFAGDSTEALIQTEEAISSVTAEPMSVEEMLSAMTLDDKISQMIMPAIRSWDEVDMTALSDSPELARALRAHQYGGIILFSQNVSDPGQTACLTRDLQANNLQNENTAVHIPYFMAADEEGGIVLRLSYGTRMTGNMAIGATGEEAVENAEKTGRILGEEMAAAGFNVDFAPVIDVNNNAANPVIGTRSFSDDPELVAELGCAWADGMESTGVIATYKHFPGHGDTGTDSHIGTPTVEKTYDQIRDMELVPYEAVIDKGADMIMTAHITFPEIDDEVTFADGKTKGFYPATMSKKIITDILRTDLDFDGVVVTDALEMGAITTAELVPGEPDSVEYGINIAKEVILAGVDILLIPKDLNCAGSVDFYDAYIDGLEAMVEDGTIPLERIDESVTRILKLKEKHDILAERAAGAPADVADHAVQVLGSDEHHAEEMEIAEQAITLLKNDQHTLPLSADDTNIVFLGRLAGDAFSISFALSQLQKTGVLDEDAQIVNLAQDTVTGEDDADTKITIDYYYDANAEDNKLHYTDELKEAISEADAVVGFTRTSSLAALEDGSEQYQGIANAIEDAHDAGAGFILLSCNLPYDAARYQDSDAILLAYMGSGMDLDPTEHLEEGKNLGAYNANVTAAIHMIFGDGTPSGILPVQIPEITQKEDGTLEYTDSILYERGFAGELF